jgi:hypothetical protein
MPIAQMILDMMHAMLRKLIPQVFISTFATVLVSTILSAVTNTTSSVTPERARSLEGESTHDYGELAILDPREPLADYMERVALTHVAALKERAAAAKLTATSAAEEPKSAATPHLPPPRRSAAPRQEPGSSKPQPVHRAANTLPPPQLVPATAPAARPSPPGKSRFFPFDMSPPTSKISSLPRTPSLSRLRHRWAMR